MDLDRRRCSVLEELFKVLPQKLIAGEI